MLDVLEALANNASKQPDNIAFDDGERTLTCRELLRLVKRLALKFADLPKVTGILAPDCMEWVVADLALSHAGKTLVPLPVFFSSQQITHIIKDAGIRHILGTPVMASTLDAIAIPHSMIDLAHNMDCNSFEDSLPQPSGCIIYTSGTTARPKGVRLGERQINAVAHALASAVKANKDDRYLSLLPFSLLLERICGICVPLLTGATVFIAGKAASCCAKGDALPLIKAAENFKPSISVLVPDLLNAWARGLAASGRKAPASLRMVAVGGAPLSAAMANAAWQVAIPVHEGYGLSECCSVVSLNRAGGRQSGTVGIPLDGVDVSIENGEIVVFAPTVMDGYLHGDDVKDKWRTGDLGDIDDNGFLRVHGRKDNVLTTASGRNINPEWIEALIMVDPRIDICILTGHGCPSLTSVLVPSHVGEPWFNKADKDDISTLLNDLCADAPEYAQPTNHIIVSKEFLLHNNLLNIDKQPHRKNITHHFIDDLYRDEQMKDKENCHAP